MVNFQYKTRGQQNLKVNREYISRATQMILKYILKTFKRKFLINRTVPFSF